MSTNSVSGHLDPTNVYTATTAFLEALTLAGVDTCFVNLGSDHPSFIEAFAIARANLGDPKTSELPRVVPVTHEFVALTAAQGYYQAKGRPAGVILHVDCGLLNAGGAIHNVWRARCPVIVFVGLSAVTQEGEARGSRTEFINWVQDVHDQSGIVRGYSKYSYEFRSSKNVQQVTMRANQIAMTEPRGPVYLFGAREVMEEPVERLSPPIDVSHWSPPSPPAMSQADVEHLLDALCQAERPLIVTSWLGNDASAAQELVKISDALAIPVLDHAPFALNFPTSHPHYQGTHWSGGGQHPLLADADVILVIDSDVPWIPSNNKPSADALVFHIDIDPLKLVMPLFYISARHRYAVSSALALAQLNAGLEKVSVDQSRLSKRRASLYALAEKRRAALEKASTPDCNPEAVQSVAVAMKALRGVLPPKTLVVSEAISNYGIVQEHLMASDSKMWKTSGASSLGYGGGAAVGAKLALNEQGDTDSFVCCITGDGSYMFSIPSTVHHLASKTRSPFLTVILVNGGWKSPRLSTLLVHPTGIAASMSADDIGVGFGPSELPLFGEIAVAAAGGSSRAACFRVPSGAPGMEAVMRDAVKAVEEGRSAVLEIIVPSIC